MVRSPVMPAKAMLAQPVPSQQTPKHTREPGPGWPRLVRASRLVSNNMCLSFCCVAMADLYGDFLLYRVRTLQHWANHCLEFSLRLKPGDTRDRYP